MLREMLTTAVTSALATLFRGIFFMSLVELVKTVRNSFKSGVGSCPVAAAWSIGTMVRMVKKVE